MARIPRPHPRTRGAGAMWTAFAIALAAGACAPWATEAPPPEPAPRVPHREKEERPTTTLAAAPELCTALDEVDRTPLPKHQPAPSDAAREKAHGLTGEAVELLDAGDIVAALAKLTDAAEIAPGHPVVHYERAYAHFLQKEYAEVVRILVRGTERYGPLGFQLLGNAYDHLGNPSCALRIYAEGLEMFPDQGGLYLETGVVHANRGDVETALWFWEQGIEKAPQYASNYFYAAQVFAQTTAPLWALFYGEAFLNLERSGTRAQQMSTILFALFSNGIKIEDSGTSVRFLPEHLIRAQDPAALASLPFASRWELTLTTALATMRPEAREDGLDLQTLHVLRDTHLAEWRQRSGDRPLEHPILEWQAQLADAGHLEAYDHWLFRAARPEEAAAYFDSHADRFNGLREFVEASPLLLDGENNLFRPRYTGLDGSSLARPLASKSEAMAAIVRFTAEPQAPGAANDCAAIVNFAVQSEAVMVTVNPTAVPWISDASHAALEPAVSSLLLCAFFAGNVRSQLETGRVEDDASAGLRLVFDVYRTLRQRHRAPRIPGIEKLLELSARGELGRYLRGQDTPGALQ